jgi:hypothetical protein
MVWQIAIWATWTLSRTSTVFCRFFFFSNPYMLRVSEAETPLLKLDRPHPAFVWACDIEYLKYVSMCRRVSRFDFGKTDVDGMILQLSAVEWSDLLWGVPGCVQKFYYAIYECFELHVPKYRTFWFAGSIVRTLLSCYDLRRSLTQGGVTWAIDIFPSN